MVLVISHYSYTSQLHLLQLTKLCSATVVTRGFFVSSGSGAGLFSHLLVIKGLLLLDEPPKIQI